MSKDVKKSIMADCFKAIKAVKKTKNQNCFHSVYSGFWTYQREKHGLQAEELSRVLKKIASDKTSGIYQRPCKGGYLIGLTADRKDNSGKRFEDLLNA